VFTIDKASGLPIYLQIKHQVVYLIALGRLTAGSMLPSIRQLAATLDVTTATIRHTYATLEADGLVVSRPGKGVQVAELNADARAHLSQREATLVDLFTPAVTRARALGYTRHEIRAALTRAVNRSDDRPRVAFVGAEPEFLERYIPILTEALSPGQAEVLGVSLQELREHGAAAVHSLDPPWCVATLVRSYAEVVRLLRDSSIPVVGLALELSPVSQAELLSLPTQARAVLVAERINLAGMLHLIEQYWAPEGGLRHVSLESKDLSAVIADAEIVIHSLRARRRLKSGLQSGCHLIELQFVFSSLSLAQLRRALTAERDRHDGAGPFPLQRGTHAYVR
jgi:DNA-binding transcriptional regulator YhcF (GntR family)